MLVTRPSPTSSEHPASADCDRCGARVSSAARYCVRCGARRAGARIDLLHLVDRAPRSTPTPDPAPLHAVAVSPAAFGEPPTPVAATILTAPTPEGRRTWPFAVTAVVLAALVVGLIAGRAVAVLGVPDAGTPATPAPPASTAPAATPAGGAR